MDLKNVGGTPGGARTFLLGFIMAVVGGYLVMQEVSVHGGYWNWGFAGGYGRSFGISLLPLLFGVGILFANIVVRLLLRVLTIPSVIQWNWNLFGLVFTALLTVATGWIASHRILGQKPLEVLREE